MLDPTCRTLAEIIANLDASEAETGPGVPAEEVHAKIDAVLMRRAVEAANFAEVGKKTISIGVATFRGEESADDLVGRADAALYQAKNSGRNKVIAGD